MPQYRAVPVTLSAGERRTLNKRARGARTCHRDWLAVTASQRAEQRLTYPARTQGQGSLAEFKNRRRYGFWKPF